MGEGLKRAFAAARATRPRPKSVRKPVKPVKPVKAWCVVARGKLVPATTTRSERYAQTIASVWPDSPGEVVAVLITPLPTPRSPRRGKSK